MANENGSFTPSYLLGSVIMLGLLVAALKIAQDNGGLLAFVGAYTIGPPFPKWTPYALVLGFLGFGAGLCLWLASMAFSMTRIATFFGWMMVAGLLPYLTVIAVRFLT